MFEKALTMFSPFSQIDETEEAETQEAKTQSAKKSGKKKDESGDEIAALKAQLSDMQEKLEKLSK